MFRRNRFINLSRYYHFDNLESLEFQNGYGIFFSYIIFSEIFYL